MFHKICVPHKHLVLAGKLFYVRLLAGKKIADLGLLVSKSIFSDENSFFCYSLHMSLTAGWEKKLIMILL